MQRSGPSNCVSLSWPLTTDGGATGYFPACVSSCSPWPPQGWATAADQRTRSGEVALAALPAKVREALDRATRVYVQPLGGASWSKVNVMKGTDHPLYQLQGTNNMGNRIEIEVTGGSAG